MNIAIIGTGHMGLAMLNRLNQEGFHCIAYNRTAEKLDNVPSGIETTTDITQAIQFADISILMVSDASAIEQLLAKQDLTDKMLLQMGTIAPEQSQHVANLVTQAGGDYVEAPVLGSIPEANAGTLLIMTGGDTNDLATCQPVLASLSHSIRHIGPIGQAAAVKLALNQLIASLTSAFSLTLGFLQNNQLDTAVFMDILRESALYAPTFDKKLQKMLDRDFESANFPLQHLLKDVRLFLNAQATQTLDSGMLKAIEHTLTEASPDFSQQDYSALFNQINPKTEN